MIALLGFVLAVLAAPFKSKSRLEAENAVLRHQLIILRRRMQGRARLTNSDRWFLIQLYRWFPSILTALTIVQPETLVRWHRAGFRCYWRWKSRSRGGRPQIETDVVSENAVELGDGEGGQHEIIGEKDQSLAGFRILKSDTSQRSGEALVRVESSERDNLIADEAGASVDRM